MAELRMLNQDGNPDLVSAFEEITGADAKATTPEIGLEFTGKNYILRWTGFKVITDNEAIRLMKAFQGVELDLR